MTTSPFASLLRPDLAPLRAYEPHPGDFDIRLDANESPPLLSPDARETLDRAVIPPAWNRYPDARVTELRHAIAATCDAGPDEILVGAGSDEVISMLLTALDRPRDRAPATTIVTTTPTFVMYSMSARVRGMKVIEVPLDNQWNLDVTGLGRAVEMGRPNVVFIASPNNPTGNLMSLSRLSAVIEASPDALVVVDEAYVDFASDHQLSLLRKHPNVAILRTLSKIGFAALRVGWMIGPAELVREVDKTRQPYNMSVPAQRAALCILRELGPEMSRIRAAVIDERERLARRLRDLGFAPIPSDANFLWVKTRCPAQDVFETLASRKILIKSFHPRGGRLTHYVRITVGLPAENDRLLEEIAACA
jgi:histidinol-phosphate aminotransferase